MPNQTITRLKPLVLHRTHRAPRKATRRMPNLTLHIGPFTLSDLWLEAKIWWALLDVNASLKSLDCPDAELLEDWRRSLRVLNDLKDSRRPKVAEWIKRRSK